MDLKTQLAITESLLNIPTSHDLTPWLQKLLSHPGSVVIIAIESPLSQNGPRVSTAWLSSQERLAIRKSLTSINAKRKAKSQPLTSEIPSHAT
jgi:hypothetical protein